MSDEDFEREGWRPSWKPALGTAALAKLPDRDDLAAPFEPFVPAPVETETGNAMRLNAIEILGARVATLNERRQRQRLTSLETRDLLEAESAIQTLRKMAPVGELLPARADKSWLAD